MSGSQFPGPPPWYGPGLRWLDAEKTVGQSILFNIGRQQSKENKYVKCKFFLQIRIFNLKNGFHQKVMCFAQKRLFYSKRSKMP